MNTHIKRWSIALLVVAAVCAIALAVLNVTSSIGTAALVAGFCGVCFLYTHISTIARDMSAKRMVHRRR